MKMIRSFIAVDIPEAVRDKLDGLLFKLKNSQADVKWVKSKSIHITLKFLGDVEEARLPQIKEIMENAVKNVQPFTVSIEGTGAFPDDRRPRVLWVGVQKGFETLIRLAADLDSQLAALGFELEKRPYSPHLTLGRVRSPKQIDTVIDMMHSMTFHAGDFLNEDILLMRSDLRPDGAVYTVLEKIKL
jgi:2'-5' RNA ligase